MRRKQAGRVREESLQSFESSSRRWRRGVITTLTVCVWFAVGHESHDCSVRMALRPSAAAAHLQRVHLFMRTQSHLLGRSGRGRSDLVLQGTARVVSSLLAAGSDDHVDEAAVVQHLLEGASARLLLLLGLLGLGGL